MRQFAFAALLGLIGVILAGFLVRTVGAGYDHDFGAPGPRSERSAEDRHGSDPEAR